MVGQRVRSALIRQASQHRGSFCSSCKRNACQRTLAPQCQECGFRTRIKIINNTGHLENLIRYLQRADPEFDIEKTLSQAALEGVEEGKESPIICISIEEGEAEPSADISKVTAEIQNTEQRPLRGSVSTRKRSSGDGDANPSSPNRAFKEARLSPDLSPARQQDESTQTYRPSDRLTKLCDAEERLHSLDAEIGAIKRLLAELSAI